MLKTQRKMLGAMLAMCDDNLLIRASLREITEKAGYKNTGGAHTHAMIFLEQSNKIVKEGENLWRITI